MNHTRTRWTLGSMACTAALAMLVARCTDEDHGGSQARGNGAGYRLRRWVGRNRWAVGLGMAAVVNKENH